MERNRGMTSACVNVPPSTSEGLGLEAVRASGVMTDEEFQRAKHRLLG